MGVHVSFELTGEMGDYVASVTDGAGWYCSPEEYVRDLIRKDIDRERREFEAFRADLQEAFAAPEEDAIEIGPDEFLASMKSQAA